MAVQVLAYRQTSDVTIPRELIMLGLWSACGIALTGLFYIAGLGVEITQALAATS